MTANQDSPTLARRLGLWGLAATGICSMVGAAINVMPFMIQRSVPEIGPYVLPAYLLAAIPAALAAMTYAALASAMPRAGGSYVFASRSLTPYLGFVASFSQWFGLSIAVGVVSYLLVPFLRDIAATVGWDGLAGWLDWEPFRVAVALAFLWGFAAVNVLGLTIYEKTLVPLMLLMFAAGAVAIPWGFAFDHAQFEAALQAREAVSVPAAAAPELGLWGILAASAILFSTFIGFDSIAQAGGEARNPGRTLPLAIGISIGVVAAYYLLFTAAVYHAVPWQFVAERAQSTDLTAPGLLGYLLAPTWTVLIVAGAAIGLINDLPAMILGVSRLMFAWSDDRIFPRWVAAVHPRRRTPQRAIALSAGMATLSILGCWAASDFFLGVDLLITGMLVNFLLMAASLLLLPRRNPALAGRIRFLRNRLAQRAVAVAALATLSIFLLVHTVKDLTAPQPAWYFHSTWLYLLVVAAASLVFWWEFRKLRASGPGWRTRFQELPPE